MADLVFRDPAGLPIKFFLQRDLPSDIVEELTQTILYLGGRIDVKVPLQGYVVLHPGSPEEERLRTCWKSDDRPERFFVPYTFIDACRTAGKLLKQIFQDAGTPLNIYIHSSIANVNARAALSQRIIHSGGNPVDSEDDARIVLADPNTEVFQQLVKKYQMAPDKCVESYLWVKKCIEEEAVRYTPLVYKNPGGRRPGEDRTAFSDEDEERLCQWIAAKIPYKETGGRTGNKLYQQLCSLKHDPGFEWVARHTWQSWRERYKKNQERLDVLILDIVQQQRRTPGERGQYGWTRQAEPSPKAKRSRNRPRVEMPIVSMIDEKDILTPLNFLQRFSTSSPSNHTTDELRVIQYSNGDSQEDVDDWAIKVGDQSPPSWAKTKDSDSEVEGESPSKKRKIDASPKQKPPPAIDSVHIIDESIQAIAKDYMFTVPEVKDFYDKCGEMSATRERFKAMRDLLSRHFADN